MRIEIILEEGEIVEALKLGLTTLNPEKYKPMMDSCYFSFLLSGSSGGKKSIEEGDRVLAKISTESAGLM